MIRCHDPKVLNSFRDLLPQIVEGFDPEKILSNPSTIFLTEGEDAALFEADGNIYSGHYLFRKARGRSAIELGKRFLSQMFNDYGAEVIKGVTPSSAKAAKWMNRQLSFTSYGTLNHQLGEFELFILHKKDFK